ncbi:single-stranded-DNA-specific exonuclease RecJ [Candidatus Ornithobacterium hominis]|uniref:single-stranded-DNA-specific exonuclease RecJ n=1 Tax=Candidatus Ornithobacterium hominis TaxID=2497989 RepID=UPI0024BD3353|nr:single-stranded-DNA-specific exonuclease RecJ [Candidatus Ornithobacterium hominis]CAI9428698.1 single-stranded-DNA-specific exonuclease RecJ [Candidatus Ornithobacterium hominis]
MSKRWVLKSKSSSDQLRKLQTELHIEENLALLLSQRGIDDFDSAKKFFRPSLDDLHDPFLMKDMQSAVERIEKAINQSENIMVYGDYDVDGTTAVSLVYLYLKQIYSNLTFYIPDRYKEGYGVSKDGIDFAADNNIHLIISLDCGIKANEQVEYARQKNIDFIIADHHLPGENLPRAVAVLDAKRKDCSYPYKELSGCGVGFKLTQALNTKFHLDKKFLYALLDLVAVSIAADIVPITGENRVLATYGLKVLNKKPRLGLAMLLPQEKKGNINISDIVFGIAPKINAAGRIHHATDAVKLLTCENSLTARKYVSQINKLNTQRKNIDHSITDEALALLGKETEKKNTNIVYQPHWHKGVIGIVASRLTETYYRPTVVFTKGEDNKLVASVRSIKGFDVYEALEECSDLFERFGGHMYAAGFSMKEVHLPEFRRKFEKAVSKKINSHQKNPSIEIDTEISFKEITPKFLRILHQFQPYGPENLNPLFLTQNALFAGYGKRLGKNGEHLKCNLFSMDSKQIFSAIAFNMGELLPRIKEELFDIVYSIEENHWQGKTYTQLNIKDLRFHN